MCGDVLTGRNKDARGQDREHRELCVHRPFILERITTAEPGLGFKLLADRHRPDAFAGRGEDRVDQDRRERWHAGFADAAWRRIGIGEHDIGVGHQRQFIHPDHREVVYNCAVAPCRP